MIRTITVPEAGAHLCTARIVAVLQCAYNVGQRAWFLTVLVERPEDGDPEEVA